MATFGAVEQPMERPMPQLNDLSRSLVAFKQAATLIAVIEMSQSSWLVAGVVPGIERQPLKKLAADEEGLLRLLYRWRNEATQAGHAIRRIVIAYEAGRDGFWLARWLRAHRVEAYVIHPSSVPVSREHRRAKTDRLDTELLKRAFLGWLRGEPKHCSMAAIPAVEDEDARRPSRERESLVGECTRIVNRLKANLARLGIRGFKPALAHAAERLEALRTPEGTAVPPNTLAELRRDIGRMRFVKQQIKEIETARAERVERAPTEGHNAIVCLLDRVGGVGIETADMLVHEVFSRNLRDRRAVARYAGLTGAPAESGKKRSIIRDGHRAGDIIRSIRALARKSGPEMTQLDINDAIREVLILMRSELQDRHVSLETQLSGGLYPILGDRVQLQQVIVNLIMNGIEAMSAVMRQPRVLGVRSQIDGPDHVLIAVEDSGPGLAPEAMDRLFDPFFTTKPGGMGMGLSICRSIVDAHGGRLWASPQSPPGAVFQFTVPTAAKKVS
jgi:transposase